MIRHQLLVYVCKPLCGPNMEHLPTAHRWTNPPIGIVQSNVSSVDHSSERPSESVSEEGPTLETLDLLSVSAVHQPFSISICIWTLPTQDTTFISLVGWTTLFVEQHCSLNNIVRWTTLFVEQHCSFNNIVRSTTLFVQQHCSAMITMLLRQCSTDNAVTTCAIFSYLYVLHVRRLMHQTKNRLPSTWCPSILHSLLLEKQPTSRERYCRNWWFRRLALPKEACTMYRQDIPGHVSQELHKFGLRLLRIHLQNGTKGQSWG